MQIVGTIAKMRRAYFVQKKAIKAISRELKVSRKVIRTEATKFEYEQAVQPRPKIGPFHANLDWLLAENTQRSGRERLTLIQIFEELLNGEIFCSLKEARIASSSGDVVTIGSGQTGLRPSDMSTVASIRRRHR